MGKKVASASKRPRRNGSQQPMNAEKIVRYVERLEQALGNDAKFLPIVDELVGEGLTAGDLVAIASRFVSPMPASTTRQRALERILKRHQNLMSFKRKQKAVGGRSAA